MQGWLGPWQAVSIWLNIIELQAAKRVQARAKERVAFRESGRLDISEKELAAEFRVQVEQLMETGYQRFEKRQRSAVLLDLPADFLAWLKGEGEEST